MATIALHGDSTVDENQWKLTLAVDETKTQEDTQKCYQNLLRAAGHEVTSFGESTVGLQHVDKTLQDNKDKFDYHVIKVPSPNRVDFMESTITGNWRDLLHNDFHHGDPTSSPNLESQHCQYAQQYARHVTKEFLTRRWDLFTESWQNQIPSHRLLLMVNYGDYANGAVKDSKRAMLPCPIMFAGSWRDEIKAWQRAFYEKYPDAPKPFRPHPSLANLLFHRHFNHIPYDAHKANAEFILHWMGTGKIMPPANIPEYGYWKEGCWVSDALMKHATGEEIFNYDDFPNPL
jgi:hypothetical protein